MTVTVSPVSVRSAVTVQRASSVDQSAAHDAVVEPDVLVDAGLARGVADVLQDRGAVGDGLAPRATGRNE